MRGTTHTRAVALGDDCATAYQARRITGATDHGVLDWTFTPADALEQLILTDFDGFFRRDNLRIRPGGDGIVDISNGVQFHHDFSRHPTEGITPAIFDAEFEKVAARYQHLVERWRMLQDATDPLLFVRGTRGADTSFAHLHDILRQRFRTTDLTLLFVRRGLAPGHEERGPILVFDVAQDAGPAPEYWRGDDANWDAAWAAMDRARTTDRRPGRDGNDADESVADTARTPAIHSGRMTISSYISLYGDWDLLRPSLWSIDDLVDEIVVVDGAYDWMAPAIRGAGGDPTRSPDEVHDVLAAFGRKIKIITGPWPNETAKRQAGYAACQGRFVMRNDADEVVSWDTDAFMAFARSGCAVAQMELPIYVGPGQIVRQDPNAPIERQSFLFDRERISPAHHLGYLWLVLPPDEQASVAPADPALIFPTPVAFTAHLTHWRTPTTAVNRARFYVMNYVRGAGGLPWLPGFTYREADGFDAMFRRVSPAAFDDILLGHPIVAAPPDMTGKFLRASGRPPAEDRVFAMLHDNMLSGLTRLNDDLCVRPRAIANGVPYVIDASTNRSLARLRTADRVTLAVSVPVSGAEVDMSSLMEDARVVSERLAVAVDDREISFRVPSLRGDMVRPIRRTLSLTVRFSADTLFATFRAARAHASRTESADA